MSPSSPEPLEGSRRNEKRATLSPKGDRPTFNVERSVSTGGTNSRLDRSRARRRQRSVSPSRQSLGGAISDGGDPERQRRGGNRERTKKERNGRRRTRRISTSSEGTAEIDWGRGTKSPGRPKHTTSRDGVANRQVKQIGAPPLATADEEGENQDKFDDSFGELAAQHPDAKLGLSRSATEPVSLHTPSKRSSSDPKSKKRASKTAAVNTNKDIDEVISQFREQCDVHMANLLELKNNITNTENLVAVDTEKEKEFQQVRQWYSALAEKHTKLQKEHQALQEEHVNLQEKYMNLKRASNLSESFAAHFVGDEKEDKKKSKKDKKDKDTDKKDKGKLEVVWSRAGKITNKLHQKLTE